MIPFSSRQSRSASAVCLAESRGDSEDEAQRGIMQAWSTFYATIGAASATLLGLLFVAVSVNAKAALGSGDRLTTAMTEQAFQNYLAVLLVALLALFPGVSATTF